MFAIVECEESNSSEESELSVSIVPTTWIIDSSCFWPNYTVSKLKAAVINREAVDTVHWKAYPGRIIKTFGWHSLLNYITYQLSPILKPKETYLSLI